MREIKFRAWDGKRMTTSSIMFNNSRGCLEVPSAYSLGAGNIPEDKQMILLQYTGLKDKNNKEIYEGDIVQRGYVLKEVKWKNGHSYCGWNIGNGYRYRGVDTLEVIGNIYENKSLLENV